ncbi:hypothetical protein LXA43DRAFT_1044988 [Ganoderma leucocontextum]|nr:hypothetical protein LXA43DRAFT_1044988 [Ganoderma leucocontextum]
MSGFYCHIDPLASLPEVPPLGNTFGALLIGTFIGLMLYGITVHQSYRYFRIYPADLPVLKWLVSFVLVLETVTSALSMHVCYHYLVSSYFSPLTLIYGLWSINLFPLVSGLAMVSTQSFFAHRIYVLSHSYRYFLAVAVLLCFVEMGFFIAATTEAFIIPTFEGFKHVTWLVSTGSTMAVASDVLITSMLISALRRSRTNVERTDSKVEVMLVYSVNTGLLTGVLIFSSLLFAFIQPGNLIYTGIGIPGIKMYANTLMAALNSHRSLAAKGSGMTMDTSPFGVSRLPALHEKNTPVVTLGRPQNARQAEVESIARTDSVLDIAKPTLVDDDSTEDVSVRDGEGEGEV